MRQTYRFCLLCAALLLVACDATRHLQPGQVLVNGPANFKGNRGIKLEQLETAVQLKSNTSILGVKAPLHLYNLGLTIRQDSNIFMRTYRWIDKRHTLENGITKFLTESAGEPPVLLDTLILRNDVSNLESLYFSEGFFNAQVTPQIRRTALNKQKVRVTYRIRENEAYIIQNIEYKTQDEEICRLMEQSRDDSDLQPKTRIREADLSSERYRIATLMRDNGYFAFQADDVSYVLDTLANRQIDETRERSLFDLFSSDSVVVDSQRIKQVVDTLNTDGKGDEEDRNKIERPIDIEVLLPDTLHQYHIGEVSFSVRRSGQLNTAAIQPFRSDTLSAASLDLIGISKPWADTTRPILFVAPPDVADHISFRMLGRRVRMKRGDLYSLEETRRTQEQLLSVGIFRNVVISYDVVDSANFLLRANVDAVLLRSRSILLGIEGFQSEDLQLNTNLPGFGATLGYRSNNIFGGGENLDLTANGYFSLFRAGDESNTQAFFQYRLGLSFSIPRFWLLESKRRSLLQFRPSTSFSLNLAQERRNEFSRTSLGFNWQYTWYNLPFSNRSEMRLSPLSISFVESDIQQSFIDSISSEALQNFILREFQDRLVTKTAFSWRYSNFYGQRQYGTTWALVLSLQGGGNIPRLLDWAGRNGRGDGNANDQRLNNTYNYGQFLGASVEFKLHEPLARNSALVGRVFLGVSDAVFGSRLVLFENRFFTGGINSNRGWQASTLGPGTFRLEDSQFNNLIAPGGEFALELNLEYRFPIAGTLYGALFTDVGNVWFSPDALSANSPPEPSAILAPENLEVGWAAGFGIRFDAEFFIARLDLGQQIYAPDIKGFVVRELNDIGGARFQYNIGIGYPF